MLTTGSNGSLCPLPFNSTNSKSKINYSSGRENEFELKDVSMGSNRDQNIDDADAEEEIEKGFEFDRERVTWEHEVGHL